jgi:hypothetical protein
VQNQNGKPFSSFENNIASVFHVVHVEGDDSHCCNNNITDKNISHDLAPNLIAHSYWVHLWVIGRGNHSAPLVGIETDRHPSIRLTQKYRIVLYALIPWMSTYPTTLNLIRPRTMPLKILPLLRRYTTIHSTCIACFNGNMHHVLYVDLIMLV